MTSLGMGSLDRIAELNSQANDYIERAKRAAATGSSVGAREWLMAADAALDAAATAQRQFHALHPPPPTVDGGERHG